MLVCPLVFALIDVLYLYQPSLAECVEDWRVGEGEERSTEGSIESQNRSIFSFTISINQLYFDCLPVFLP
jgi:hypothetical protein